MSSGRGVAASAVLLVVALACAPGADRTGTPPDTASPVVERPRGDAGAPDHSGASPAQAAGASAPAKAEARAPRHLSLLIGIGDYRHAAEWTVLRNLRGPPHDVLRMQHTLRRWGFTADSGAQRVLLDGQATKAGIERAFRWLASQATDTADVVVIYYSGHGSWAPDVDIDAIRRRDEHLLTPGDSADEAFVPWDARDPHDPRQLVLDDEIGHWLDALGTTNVTMIVDACFSGTITRGSPDLTSETAPRARGPRPPPFATLGGGEGFLEGAGRIRHTLITAASAWELAYEKTFHPGGTTSGVLTRHLADALDAAPPTMRFDDLLHQVRTRMGQNQTPQLEGDRSARLFRVGRGVVIPERGYALVTRVSSGMVALDVGAVHGVRLGAVYEVFGPAEARFTGRPIALVRVDSITDAISFARALPGGRAITRGARATLSRVPPGALALDRLTVYLPTGARALRDALRELEWVVPTGSPEAAMAELRERGGVVEVLVNGHLIAPLLAEDSLGITRHDQLGESAIRGYHSSAAALCAPLRRAFSTVAMHFVRNEHPPAGLRLDVRVLPAGTSPVRTRGAVDTLHAGSRYTVWVWAQLAPEIVSHPPLYLSVGVSGYTSRPGIIWPVPTETGPISALARENVNQPIRLGTFLASPVLGVEVVKAVVSTDPYDLRPLIERLPRCGTTPRGRGLQEEVAPDETPLSASGWTTAERLVEIHPAGGGRR